MPIYAVLLSDGSYDYREWPSGEPRPKLTAAMEVERLVKLEHKAKWDARIEAAKGTGER